MSELNSRKNKIDKLATTEFDCLIIGGGATGSGAAHDASLRGLKVALIEKNDFSSGTSSRSTKLIHGGVRYLGQFHFKLIKEALHERKTLLENVPHLVKALKFILPTYSFFEKPYYGIGLTLYDILAGDSGLPSHKTISKKDTIKEFPAINQENLTGSVVYYDAQFNDSRLNVLLSRSAQKEGAVVCNKIEFVSFVKENGKIIGAVVRDSVSEKNITIKAKLVINTTGVWVDEIRKLDDPDVRPVLAPSQGIHIVFSKEKLPIDNAMIIPKTSDGRVVFVIPWEDHVVMGTTDTFIDKVSDEPMPLDNEIDFLLKTGNLYLENKLTKSDILSVFTGLRPLISLSGDFNTKKLSREEMILVSQSGLITMSGGKWSTYRKMAQDLTDKIIEEGNFKDLNNCSTSSYVFIGKKDYSEKMYLAIADQYKLDHKKAKRLRNFYGGEVFEILGKAPTEIIKGSGYFEEEVKHFIKNEFALTILDVISRRFRVLFTNLEFSKSMIKPISELMAKEFNWSSSEKNQEEKEALELIAKISETIK